MKKQIKVDLNEASRGRSPQGRPMMATTNVFAWGIGLLASISSPSIASDVSSVEIVHTPMVANNIVVPLPPAGTSGTGVFTTWEIAKVPASSSLPPNCVSYYEAIQHGGH